MAAGRRVVVSSQCAGDCAGGEVVGEESVEEFDILILGDKRAEGDDLRAGDFSLCARAPRLVGLKSTRVE